MYRLSTLDNGLRVLPVTMPYLQSVSVGFFMGVGSRYESDALAGASHFVEHMLFKGTERRPTAWDIAEAIEGKGGVFNASTGLETTLYWAKVATAHLPDALDVLSDMLLNATFDPAEMEKERDVIAEEINYSLTMPASLAQMRANELQWPEHPLGRDVAGTPQSVATISRQALLAFRSDHYRPGDTILSVAGPVTHEDLLDLVESNLAGWEPGPRMHYTPAPSPNGQNDPRILVETKDSDQVQISMSFAGMSRQDPNRFALRLLNILLGEGMRSRLFQEVRERLGLAYNVGSYVTTMQDTGTVGAYAGVAEDRTEEALQAILAQFDLMRQELVAEDELQAARQFIRGRLALSLEDPFTLASWYARQELLEPEVLEPEEALTRIDSVQAEHIRNMAQAMFRPDRLNLAIVAPFSDNGDRFRQTVNF